MWDNEKRFINEFLGAMSSLGKPSSIFKGFRTGFGLPDILIIEYDEGIFNNRIEGENLNLSAPFDMDCAYAMVYLSKRRWIRLENFKSNFKAHNGSIDNIIKNLVERRLVKIENGNIKSFSKKQIFAIMNIRAIEAKLRNWRRAIYQAHRHLWFTNDSNVLIPEMRTLDKNKIMVHCSKYRVGLITLSKDRSIKNISQKRKVRPYNTHLAWYLNEKLIEEIKNGQSRI